MKYPIVLLSIFACSLSCKVNKEMPATYDDDQVVVDTTSSSQKENPNTKNGENKLTALEDDCYDPMLKNPYKICDEPSDFVCGCDGKTYKNACEAEKKGIYRMQRGPCAKKSDE